MAVKEMRTNDKSNSLNEYNIYSLEYIYIYMCAGQKGRYYHSFLTLPVKFSIFAKTIIKESAV